MALLVGLPCESIADDSTSPTSPPISRKPSAPTRALLPATRLRRAVDKAYDLSTHLHQEASKNYQILVQMNKVLTIERPPLFQQDEKVARRTSTPTAQLTTVISAANKQQYQQLRKGVSISNRMTAMLNQADVERQWGMLQYQESKAEQDNEWRAALNHYTTQLEFGDSYTLTASKDDRKRLIRDDALPSLTAVITSDLDLRDLYRNEFLTAIADVQAEVDYQLKNSDNAVVDVTEVVPLMAQAHTSLNKWFDLIDAKDVQEAMDVVAKQQQQQQQQQQQRE